MSNRIGLVCVMGGCGFSPNPDADTSVLPFPPPVCSPRAPSALPQYDIGDLYAVIVSPSSETALGSHFGVPGDIDGDGCDDFAVTSEQGLHVFFGPLGPGVWSIDEADVTYGTNPASGIYRAGDVDHDGREDVWYGTVLLAYHDAGFELLASFRNSGAATITGDFDADGDGELDALVGSGVYSQAMLVYGPLAAWGESEVWPGSDPQPPDTALLNGPCGNDEPGIAQWLGDMDGDRIGEILVGHCSSGGVIFHGGDLRGQTLGLDETWVSGRFGTATQNAMDVDGDGSSEIADALGIWSGSSLASEVPELLVSGGDRLVSPLGGDVDRDGRPDFLVREEDNRTSLWVVSGHWTSVDSSVVPDLGIGLGLDGGLTHDPVFPDSPRLAADTAGDITGDGGVDLIHSDQAAGVGGEIYIWSSSSITVALPPSVTGAAN